MQVDQSARKGVSEVTGGDGDDLQSRGLPARISGPLVLPLEGVPLDSKLSPDEANV